MPTGLQIAQQAKEQLQALTNLKAETVSSLSHEGEGWQVVLEMVEMKYVPDTMDVLGSYEVLLDAEGNVVSYARTRRYHRGDTEEKQA